ncbi:MAG TPA: hypothetical protein VHE10_02765 [Candidatus Paceibacterota bacterium]|nr:hypothetical protein [Candidatus Paceibacterota bacterium]
MDNNQKNYGMWAVVVLIVILVGLSIYFWNTRGASTTPSSTSTPSGTSMVNPYGTATVGLGQEAVFPGITIIPLSVSEDSRCAAGVQCIWAGTVRVVVRSVLDSGGSQQDVISLGSTTPIDAYTVSLISVEPQAVASTKIADQDYRFTFDVHQNASGVTLQGKG